jgi:hypothetical protein
MATMRHMASTRFLISSGLVPRMALADGLTFMRYLF